MTDLIRWHDGPPRGVLLVILDEAAVAEHYHPEIVEYYGDPVAVRWWGHKGKDTFGCHRIDASLVLRWAKLGES
jgi:hypothetical protein